MRNYDTKFIKEYIEEHKAEIDYVECGMREDWLCTAEIVYENCEFCKGLQWSADSINVAGISGSIWATPVMVVHTKDGDEGTIECWSDDGYDAPHSRIREAKAFATSTGGMDYRQ